MNQEINAKSMDEMSKTLDGDSECCEEMATTTFTDEGAKVAIVHPNKAVDTAIIMKNETIIDFLKKPYLIRSGSISTGNTRMQSLANFDIGSQLTTITYWANKLQGFNLFRGKAVVRLVINSNPFQQGKVLMSFLPCFNDINGVDVSYVYKHTTTLACLRQTPCVEHDLRQSTSVLEIPYITPYHWYDLKKGAFDWGRVLLTLMAPLLVGPGGETTVDYAMYLHFEDVELGAPMVPQMGKIKGKNISEKEDAAMAHGTISDSLRLASKVATTAAGIPLLSSVAAPAAWFTGAMAEAASAFGWSKPTTEVGPSVMSKMFNRYGATSEGPDLAIPLGLIAGNKTEVSDATTLYDCDEMSFNFLKGISTVVKEVTWTDAQVSGTSLLSYAVSPGGLCELTTKTGGGHTASLASGPPVFYLSNAFQFWRGGIDIVIKIIKTDYHSGRLQITWTPYNNSTETAPTLTSGIVALREIIDVRCTNEIKLTLPYLLSPNYLPVETPSGQSNVSGFLDIVVLNELRHPETCASSVLLQIYGSGSDDFEFQAPKRFAYGAFSPQMNTEGIDKNVDKSIGDTAIVKRSPKYAYESVGEDFSSIKQIISRYNQVMLTSMPGSADQFAFWPWANTINYLSAGLVSSGAVGGDPYSYLSQMYLFYKGAMRIGVRPAAGSATAGVFSNVTGWVMADPALAGQQPLANITTDQGRVLTNTVSWTTTNQYTQGNFAYAVTDSGNGYSAFSVPYYGPGRCSFVLNQTSTLTIPNEASQPNTRLVVSGKDQVTLFTLQRSCSDEFHFSYFLGCPPVIYSYS